MFQDLLITPEFIFWASALFGTTLFILRLLMFILGIGDAHDTIQHDHAGVDADDAHSTSSGSFKVLTLHSISGFFMMLGWVGLACIKQLQYSSGIAIIYGLVAGVVIMLLTALLFRWSRMMVSPGTQFDITKTIGLTGTVYQEIPQGAQGKIHVVVDGVTRELLAQGKDGRAIPSFVAIKIHAVLDYEVVIVAVL